MLMLTDCWEVCREVVFFVFVCDAGRFAFVGRAVWFSEVFAGIRVTVFALSLASALCLRASSVAPVRGGTYFSLPPQRKVGKRKRLTPPTFLLA
ncbi:hypothetical protein Q8F57_002095 [Paraburkholderia terrae]|uniref:hypothetical protein n=1 Tax=Paraburkholderia terrae TaxID=311230 RepID=UPI00296A9FAA|nr:hypothetical protein [Paraburkholderia terrae]MDW3662014.1 hypothetical protein [Paraburkholderia terrae]